jgi:hypothetical protein
MNPNDIIALISAAATSAYQAGVEAAQAASNVQATEAGTSAFKSGYEMGYADAKDEIGDTTGDKQAAYDHGFMEGHAHNEQAAYDDGYIDGVSDARVSPSDADARVAELCAYENFDGFDYDFDPSEYTDLDDGSWEWVESDYDFDHLEPKENASVEGDSYVDFYVDANGIAHKA